MRKYTYCNNTDFPNEIKFRSKTALLHLLNQYRDYRRETWGDLYHEYIRDEEGNEYIQTGKRTLEGVI